MATKLWVAERVIEYEGNDILGVFTTKGKAIEECQRYEKDYEKERGDRPSLKFYQFNSNVFLANGYSWNYSVYEVEIDKGLMS